MITNNLIKTSGIHTAKDVQEVAVQNSNNTQDVTSAVEEQTASFEEVSANISTINEMATDLTKIQENIHRFV